MKTNSAFTTSKTFWIAVVVLMMIALLVWRLRTEGLTPAKKDVKITKGLPSNVKYVVKKANGETKVVYTSGNVKRYPKGQLPSFLKNTTAANAPAAKKKKDVTITKGLPSNVAYVVKKANGETVVVNNDGTQDRYGVGKLPSFLKKSSSTGTKGPTKGPTKGNATKNKPKTPGKDVTITKNLPADVKYVVRKANGETTVVKKNGQKQRYPKGKTPSFLKPTKPSSGGSGGGNSGGGGKQPANVKEIGKAIAAVQKKLDGINSALKVVQTNQKDTRILEQVRGLLDERLSKLKEKEQQCYNGMYVDKGEVWVLE